MNQTLGEEKYQSVYVGENPKEPIILSDSPLPVTAEAQAGLDDIDDYNCLIVIADQLPQKAIKAKTKKALLTYQQSKDKSIIALQAGWYWLLESGVGLDDSWAIHWRWEDEVKARFPNLNVRYEGHSYSNNLISCASATESLSVIINFLAQYEDAVTVRAIRDEFYLESSSNEPNDVTAFNAELPPRLQKAISLMESNLEEPISTWFTPILANLTKFLVKIAYTIHTLFCLFRSSKKLLNLFSDVKSVVLRTIDVLRTILLFVKHPSAA